VQEDSPLDKASQDKYQKHNKRVTQIFSKVLKGVSHSFNLKKKYKREHSLLYKHGVRSRRSSTRQKKS